MTRGSLFRRVKILYDTWPRSCLPAKIYLKCIDTTIVYTFLSAPACTACTDMVYWKELERDVTTSAKAILRLKTLVFIPSWNMIGSIFYIRRTNKGCHVHAMCKMLLF